MVTGLENYETFITSLENINNLSTITLIELIHLLQAQKQQRLIRGVSTIEGKIKVFSQSRTTKGVNTTKTKDINFPSCSYSKKNHQHNKC